MCAAASDTKSPRTRRKQEGLARSRLRLLPCFRGEPWLEAANRRPAEGFAETDKIVAELARPSLLVGLHQPTRRNILRSVGVVDERQALTGDRRADPERVVREGMARFGHRLIAAKRLEPVFPILACDIVEQRVAQAILRLDDGRTA